MDLTWLHGSLVRLFLGLCLTLGSLTQTHWRVDTVFWVQSGNRLAVDNDLRIQRDFEGAARVEANVTWPRFGGNRLRLAVDDRLTKFEINDHDILLDHPEMTTTIGLHGAVIDVGKYRRVGQNTLSLEIVNQSGPGGVNLDLVPFDWQPAIPGMGLIVGLCLIWSVVATWFGLRISIVLVASTSLVWLVLYWLQTPFSVRQFDIYEGGGHLDYLRHVWLHHALPPANGGWEYHQPPAYYLTSAWLMGLGSSVPLWGWQSLLRLWSVLHWMVFLGAELAILQTYLWRTPWRMHLAALALCCWPAGFIHAIRTGNDIAFIAVYTLGLWVTVRWWHNKRVTWFVAAAGISIWAALCKANGLALCGVLGALLGLRWWHEARRELQTRFESLRFLVAMWCMSSIAALGLSFFAKWRDYWHGRSHDWLLGSVGESINTGLRVSNDWAHLIGIDLNSFFKQIWISPWRDDTGRQYVWNYLLRSSLTSEFDLGAGLRWVFVIAGVILLFLVARLLWRLLRWAIGCWRYQMRAVALRQAWVLAPLWLSAVALLCLLWAYRVRMPYASNTDFRYVYPILVTLVICDAAPLRPSDKGWFNTGWLVSRLERIVLGLPVGWLLGLVGMVMVLLL